MTLGTLLTQLAALNEKHGPSVEVMLTACGETYPLITIVTDADDDTATTLYLAS